MFGPSDKVKDVEFAFPFRGVVESSGVAAQPEGTSPLAYNVRGYDLIAQRDRGCQRAGYRKFIKAINTSAKPIDLIRTAFLGPSATIGGIAYTYSAATMIATGAGPTGSAAGKYGNIYPYAYQHFYVTAGKTSNPNDGSTGSWFTPGYQGFQGATVSMGALLCLSDTNFTVTFTLPINNGNSGNDALNLTITNNQADLQMRYGSTILNSRVTLSGVGSGNAQTYLLTVGTSSFTFTINGATKFGHTFTTSEQALFTWPTGSSPILRIESGSNPGTNNLYDAITMAASATLPNYDPLSEEIAYCQNGHIFCGNPSGGFAQMTDTASVYTVGSAIDMCNAYGTFYFVGGVAPLLIVDPGAGTTTLATTSSGSIPTGATLIALYRGRLFLSGVAADPFNYFASRSGTVLDFNYAALDSAGAFAGNNTLQAGYLGDRITAMIPYGDVSMIFGMGSSIAIMQGDPKAGGTINMLSREVGIVSPTAWARSPDGDLYFMARDGLYVISGEATRRLDLYGGVAAAAPKPMSRGLLDTTLGRIDFTTTKVLMSWDPLELGLKIVLVPNNPAAPTTVVFWEQRKKAFWIDTISSAIAPTAIAPLRGSGGPGGALLIGSYDGWLRQMDPVALDDDGNLISSRVRYAPQQFFGPNVRAKLLQMRQLWGDMSGQPCYATWGITVADDPVTASASSPSLSGTVTSNGGYQPLILTRLRGACMILELGNTQPGYTWQVEKITAMVAPSGRVRD